MNNLKMFLHKKIKNNLKFLDINIKNRQCTMNYNAQAALVSLI